MPPAQLPQPQVGRCLTRVRLSPNHRALDTHLSVKPFPFDASADGAGAPSCALSLLRKPHLIANHTGAGSDWLRDPGFCTVLRGRMGASWRSVDEQPFPAAAPGTSGGPASGTRADRHRLQRARMPERERADVRL